MKVIHAVIYVEPKAKARPRSRIIKGAKPIIQTYTPKKTQMAEAMVVASIRKEVMKQGAFDAGVPLRLEAVFYRLRPEHLAKRITMPISRPDLDNHAKLLLDALNHYIYPDDNQIITMVVKKRFGNPPRIEVKIREEVE